MTRETARNWIAKMGLPVKKDPTLNDPLVPPPGSGEKAAATGDALTSTVTPTAAASDDRALVDRVLAELHTLPPAVGQEVRLVLGEIVALKGEDADAKAVAAARSALGSRYAADVVTTASAIETDDRVAGEVMRRYWLEHGLSGEFRSPGELVKTALSFWWANRDEVRHLRDDLDAANLTIDELQLQVSAESRIARARDEVMLLALGSAVKGVPLPPETLMGYLRGARDLALAGDGPASSPPAIIAVAREG